MGTLAYIGEMTIGAAIPGAVTAITVTLPTLEAQIAALAGFSVQVNPPTFDSDLVLAGEIMVGLQAAMSMGLTPPTIQAQFDLVASILANLRADLAVALGIVDLFAAAGVHAYAYSGTADTFGASVTSALASGLPGGSGGGQSCHALVLVTTVSATWSAMGTVFRVTP